MNEDLNLLLHPETSCSLLLSKSFYQMSISDQIFPSRNLKISTVWKETLARECQNLELHISKFLPFLYSFSIFSDESYFCLVLSPILLAVFP